MDSETRDIQIRVRPPKIAVVTSSDTTTETFLRTIEFLSLVRGGAFARFIHANLRERNCFEFFCEECKKFQPELLILATPHGDKFKIMAYDESRPVVLDIPSDFKTNFSESEIGGLIPWYRVVREETRAHPNLKRNNLFLLRITGSVELQAFAAVAYGKLSDDFTDNLAQELHAPIHEVDIKNVQDLYALHRFMSARSSWLAFLNRGLSLLSPAWYPPIVVMVEASQPIRDLGIFWNLQNHLAPGGRDDSILLLPEQDAEDRKTLRALADTLRESRIHTTFAYLRTAADASETARRVARSLRRRLNVGKDKPFHVDIEKKITTPVSYAYEKMQAATVSRDDVGISVERVTPQYRSSSAFGTWYMDLVKDEGTGRYPFELSLPIDVDLLDLLNVPSGRSFAFRPLWSRGAECLSLSCTGGDGGRVIQAPLPNEHELFEVVLRRAGCHILHDEKNTIYSRLFALMGSVFTVGRALLGRSWAIIEALLEDPCTYDQLCGRAKLGKRKKNAQLPEFAGIIRTRYSGIYGEIFERRVRAETGTVLLEESTPDEILEFLVRKHFIQRKWLLDPCPSCQQSYWVSEISLSSPMVCQGCRNQITLRDRVKLGYELNSLVRLAIEEGTRPVLLTARFLFNLSSEGCRWYPGAKISQGNRNTDFDLLACADGTLIAGECKDLEGRSRAQDLVWTEIVEQLVVPIEIAKLCGFKIFFVSSFVESYPNAFQKRLKGLAGDSLLLLFITKKDLEAGRRKVVDEEGHESSLNLGAILYPGRKKRRKKVKEKDVRRIGF